jgi:hypothetical protein
MQVELSVWLDVAELGNWGPITLDGINRYTLASLG